MVVFVQSCYIFAGINGYIYGNMPSLELCVNQSAFFYTMTSGGSDNMHSFNILGQLKHYQGRAMGSWVVPGVFKVDRIQASREPGETSFHLALRMFSTAFTP